jgi:hypothetical protein
MLGDFEDGQEVAHRHLRPPADKMDDPVMRAAKPVLRQDRVGLGRKVAIGEEQ